MTSLYEVLKRSKTAPQLAPDMFTALWAKSITTGKIIELSGQVPLSFKANGKPLIDYTISGNMEQSGTPTPSDPVDVNGVGERTNNLFDYTTMADGVVGKYLNADGTTTDDSRFTITDYIPCDTNTVTLYRGTFNNRPAICCYDENKNYITGISYNAQDPVTLTASQKFKYVRFSWKNLTHAGPDVLTGIRLNNGAYLLPYEPYGYKIPISNGQQTTNIDLGSTQTTRRIKKYEITGKEDWEEVAGAISNPPYFRLPIGANGSIIAEMIISSHYEQIFVASPNSNNGIDIANSSVANASILKIRDTNIFTDTATLKAYLAAQYAAGTPVTVWYVLKTPETGIVNEPLMRIGNYADTLSMEQAGVQIPTNKGSTTLDVLTTVKPSNVSIKYRV